MAFLKLESRDPAVSARTLQLSPNDKVSIGRFPGKTLELPHAWTEISRSQATISFREGHYQIVNESDRGTQVGDERIHGAHRLQEGDEIELGPVRLVFHDDPVTPPPPPPPKPVAPPKIAPSPVAVPPERPSPVVSGPAELLDFGVPPEMYAAATLSLKKRIHARVLEKLNLRELGDKPTANEEMRQKMDQALDRVLQEVAHELPLGVPLESLRHAMQDELMAYGPISPMLRDPTVKEVMVNGAGRIFVDRDGLKETRARFADDEHLMAIIRRIVEPLGRRIDEASPKVDARLPDGNRVNAIIPPLALDGPSLTIRKFPESPLTIDNLVGFGSLSRPMALFLEEAVRAKQNIVVSGGTGSGKTTLLNVLSQFIPKSERIVTIEDSAELRLTHRNLVRLEARPPNIEGKGAVTIRDLVVNALRMRPDRIVVGECRGAEALDMLQAMSTGHDGSLTTIHANDPRGALSRLETMVLMAGYEIPSRAIREQIVGAVNIVVQQSRLVDDTRKIERISEIAGREGDVITMQDIFLFEQQGFEAGGKKLVGTFRATGNKPRFIDTLVRKKDLRLDPAVFRPEA